MAFDTAHQLAYELFGDRVIKTDAPRFKVTRTKKPSLVSRITDKLPSGSIG